MFKCLFLTTLFFASNILASEMLWECQGYKKLRKGSYEVRVYIYGQGWRREIDYRSKKLKVVDSKENNYSLPIRCQLKSNGFIEYSNLSTS